MTEINALDKHTRTLPRPPLRAVQLPGPDLYTRLELPRYRPPKPPVLTTETNLQTSKVRQTAAPRLTLRRLLASNPSLPQPAAVLGVGEDQMPVILDLNDPAPGALLVISDERPQQLELLRVAMVSLALRSSPRQVQFVIFSHLPGAWRTWVSDQQVERHVLAVLGTDEAAAVDWLARLSEMQAQRRGPVIVMIFDTLNFLPRLNAEARADVEALIEYGAARSLWTMAAISTALANSLKGQLDCFHTVLYGYSANAGFYTRMAGLSDEASQGFLQPGQFAVHAGEDWLKFSLPVV